MNIKATVVYRRDSIDGKLCRAIAQKALGSDGVQFIGWQRGDPCLNFPAAGMIYLLGVPFGVMTPGDDSRIVWCYDMNAAQGISGFQIGGVATCRLAYQWFNFFADAESEYPAVPPVEKDYVNRNVVEPMAVRLVGEYAIGDDRGDGDIELAAALADWKGDWSRLLEVPGHLIVQELIYSGKGDYRRDYENAVRVIEQQKQVIRSLRGKLEKNFCEWCATSEASRDAQDHYAPRAARAKVNSYQDAPPPYYKTELDKPVVPTRLGSDLRRYLDSMTITSDNIGEIRRSLFMPFETIWNSVVRDETTKRENKACPPNPGL